MRLLEIELTGSNMNKPKASFAPLYCAIYPELAEAAKSHGYALSLHGSLARDFDLVCIPWVEAPESPEKLIEHFKKEFLLESIGKPELKSHGRIAHTLKISYDECFIDLSFIGVGRLINVQNDAEHKLALDTIMQLVETTEQYEKERWPVGVNSF